MPTWTTQGFESFRTGTFGNAGHNLYVSRTGILQRIHHFDLDQNGHLDIVICNSQAHYEMPPAGVYRDPLGSCDYLELPADGARSGAVLDLNGDGFDDLVLGNRYNGVDPYVNATIYYGSPNGWSERRSQRLPAPRCTAVAAADFNGDGRPDLAFLCDDAFSPTATSNVRIFYQSELGFEPRRYVDLEIDTDQIGAGDLDEDGVAELLARSGDGEITVYWGAPEGIDTSRSTVLPITGAQVEDTVSDLDRVSNEYIQDAKPLVQVVQLNEQPHIFAALADSALLVPVDAGRQFGAPLTFACVQPMAVATGDVNGDGHQDLVFACREPAEMAEKERSWIYWGGGPYSESSRTALPTYRACDVALGDVDGDGCDDIVICHGYTPDWNTRDSLLFRGGPDIGEPIGLTSHDGRRVFVARPKGEGNPDVVFINHQGRQKTETVDISIYPGEADGYSETRRQDLPGFGAVCALCCDFDDDGRADLALVNSAHNTPSRDPGSFIYRNDDGFSAPPTWILPTDLPHGACCADFDRDGYLDLVFGCASNAEIQIFHGGPDGFEMEPERIRLGEEYTCSLFIYAADLNNDGWLDLILPQSKTDRSIVLWGGPDGYSFDQCQLLSVWKAICARAADLTGNGYLDLILGNAPPSVGEPHDCFVTIYWNGPEGLREDNRTLLPANGVDSVAIGDFDNDGLLDLFVPSYSDSKNRDLDSLIYWNRPGRGFTASDRTRLFTHAPAGSLAADLNENGWTDLVVGNHKIEGDHVGWSAVYWNGPDGFSDKNTTRLPSAGPHGMFCVDPGNIHDRSDEEIFVSSPAKLSGIRHITRLTWDAELQTKTWVKAQIRSASSERALDQATWLGPDGASSWFAGKKSGRAAVEGEWVQYRLVLGARNGGCTPRVRAVHVEWDDVSR